jgi:uncharacterized protein
MTRKPGMDSAENPAFTAEIVTAIASIPATDWDALAAPHAGERPTASDEELDNPFLRHAFLLALETSGCVGGRTGWQPAHIVVKRQDGSLVAAAPAYIKAHSMGEYVFDHSWAEALQRAGVDYYPKLQVAVPFTPVTGPRLLVAPAPDADLAEAALIAALPQATRQLGASSAHVTFPSEQEWRRLGENGFLQRIDQQFHFLNEGYADFEGFLAALSSRKRKTIRRERRAALENGVEILQLRGDDITEAHWDAFFAFYMDTGSRKWGRPYLNRAFFSEIGRTMAERILLIMARRDGRFIAGAINFLGEKVIYGRNWGCIEDHPFLHFEVCYYQAIDYAITHGYSRVEAGAQGEHKLARGYRPALTYSAHYIAHPGLQRAVRDYLAEERRHVLMAQDALDAAAPFKRSEPAKGDGMVFAETADVIGEER